MNREKLWLLSIALLITWLFTQSGLYLQAQNEPTPNAQSVELIGQIGGAQYASTIQGDFVYAGIGPRLVILNVADPSRPFLVGQTEVLSAPIMSVAVDRNIAYAAAAWGGLRVIDVSKPESPVEIGFYETPGFATGIDVVGDIAYVTDGEEGLRLINVANPVTPIEVGYHDTPGWAFEVVVANNIAYVSDGEGGLRLIEVTNPLAPLEVGYYDGLGNTHDVAVVGNLAYIAAEGGTWNGGLGIIDVTNSVSPVLLSSIEIPGNARGVSVVGENAYFTAGSFGLHLIDVTNPFMPVELSSYHDKNSLYWSTSLIVDENVAYVSDYSGLRFIDVSDRMAPTEIGFYDEVGFSGGSFTVAGDILYFADGIGGVFLVDVSNPARPSQIFHFDTPGEARDIVLIRGIIYVADRFGGLRIIEVTNPFAPVETSFFQPPEDGVNGITVADNVAYAAGSTLHIIDLNDSTAPREIGSYNLTVKDMVIDEDNAYIAVGDNGIHILDISNPAVPIEKTIYDTPGSANAVVIDGEIAYIADGESGLRILNVSNPATPYEIGYYDTPGRAEDVDIEGGIAYVADFDDGLRLINVANPEAPVEVGFYYLPGWTNNVVVEEGIIYVDHSEYGLLILHFMSDSDYSVPVLSTLLPAPTELTDSLPIAETTKITIPIATQATLAVEQTLGETEVTPVPDEELESKDQIERVTTPSAQTTPKPLGVIAGLIFLTFIVSISMLLRRHQRTAKQLAVINSKICSYCFTKNPANGRYCKQCGRPLNER